ncbi:MAG: hypothetical protein ABI880_05835 [Acidobacteriota bacterium]
MGVVRHNLELPNTSDASAVLEHSTLVERYDAFLLVEAGDV